MKNKILNILFWILVAITTVVGILCLVSNRIPEGLIIVGAVIVVVFIVTTTLRGKVHPSRRVVVKAAGRIIVELKGACRINGGRSEECILKLCTNGVFFDMPGTPMDLIKYDDIELQDSKSNYHIQFKINDIGICRFVCDSKIKFKAVAQTIELQKGETVH